MQVFDRLCLFAHYDRTNGVADHVLHYLAALRDCGFAIVVVSNSQLTREAHERLSGLAFNVIIRAGGGLDLRSYAVGFASHQASVGGLLLLTNDSVYGPVADLRTSLDRLLSVDADVYGMVESQELCTHLQSWFLAIKPSVHRHPAFAAFLAQDFQTMSKDEIICNGELEFSAMLRREGFRTNALYQRRLNPMRRFLGGVNPTTTALWQRLIFQYGVPFVKIQLLRENPERVAGLDDWRDIVAAQAPELVPMIEAHQRHEMGVTHGPIPLHHIKPRFLGSAALLLWIDQAFWRGARTTALLLSALYRLLRAVERRLR
jgi:lipopolysaccharide biosynthesis protein